MSDPVRRAPPGSKLVVVASQAEEEVKRIAVEARYAVERLDCEGAVGGDYFSIG